jgi:glycosyltransferase involved in cell wall biosynthesis
MLGRSLRGDSPVNDVVGPYRSVLWAYGKGHLDHPFIVLAIRSLLEHGCEVTMINAQDAPANAGYSSIVTFYPKRVAESWDRNIEWLLWLRDLSHRLQEPITRYFVKSRTGRLSEHWRLIQVVPLFAFVCVMFVLRRMLRGWATIRFHWLETSKPLIKSVRHLLVRRCDVIVATRPIECFVAFAAARLRGKRFVYYPFELYGCQHGRSSVVAAYLERKMLKLGVDALITQNSKRGEVYRNRGAAFEPVIVRNFKPCQLVRGGLLRPLLGLRPEQRIVLYEGGLMPGRWLANLARASLLFKDGTVLVMMGSKTSWWRDHAAEFVCEPQAMGRLIVMDAVPQDRLLDHVADADVGVIIYDDAVLNNVYCEPGKLSDYVHAGVPVIAPDFPTISPLIEELGIGVCFQGGTPEMIAAAVHAVLLKGRNAWQPSLMRAAPWVDWATQSPALISAITGGEKPQPDHFGASSRPKAATRESSLMTAKLV